jgi:hypothetical protein
MSEEARLMDLLTRQTTGVMRHAAALPCSVRALTLPMVGSTALTTLVSLTGCSDAPAPGFLSAGRAAKHLAVITGGTDHEDPTTPLPPTRPHAQHAPRDLTDAF